MPWHLPPTLALCDGLLKIQLGHYIFCICSLMWQWCILSHSIAVSVCIKMWKERKKVLPGHGSIEWPDWHIASWLDLQAQYPRHESASWQATFLDQVPLSLWNDFSLSYCLSFQSFTLRCRSVWNVCHFRFLFCRPSPRLFPQFSYLVVFFFFAFN